MSAVSKPLPLPPNNFSTQIASTTVSTTALSITLDSVAGLGTEGVGVLFKKDTQGNVKAGTIEFCHWTGVSGSAITFTDTGDRGITGSDSGAQAYVADDYFEVWVTSYYHLTSTDIVSPNGIQTLTNKTLTAPILTGPRTTKRVDSQVTTDTITPEPSTYDKFVRTAQAHALVINNHSTSTPTDGELMLFELVCDGTARALTYGDKYLAKAGTALPSTLVASKTTTLLFQWSAALSGWNLLAVGQEA